jgi:uncharacterized protein (DUF2235 family)
MALYAFDGTWNSASTLDDVVEDSDTNVVCLYEFYRGRNKWYAGGVGTRHGLPGRIIGGLFGAGARDRLGEAYKALCRNFAAGDREIDIVGFSRGAALALDFANRIKDMDVREPEGKRIVAEDPPIRFLGLWDVVGSFGMPIDIGPLDFQGVNLGHKFTVPDIVEHCFHALAIDERRQAFRVTQLMNAYEVWFRGVHSDVGGGNGNHGLSSIALRWMLRKAAAAGLPIDAAKAAGIAARADANTKIRPAQDVVVNEYRGFLANDRFHHTVSDRLYHNNPPADCPRETEADEAAAIPVSALPPKRVDPVV